MSLLFNEINSSILNVMLYFQLFQELSALIIPAASQTKTLVTDI